MSCRNRGGRAAFARVATSPSCNESTDPPTLRSGTVTLVVLNDEAQKLLQTHLDSFEKLELVRALRTSGRPMSRDDLEVECRFTPDTVHEALESLSHARIVEFDAAAAKLARLGPSSHAPAFQAVMEFYENDRHAVLTLLSTMAMERIRSMTARAFADAFVLRKKRDDGDG